MRPLTKRQVSALRALAWGTEHFGALVTGRATNLATVLTLIRRGLAKDAGMVLVCDGDGYALVPERYRQGFAITPEGTAALAEAEAEQPAQEAAP